MYKKLIISLLAVSSFIAAEAMAEVGFQFRVPFQISGAPGVSNSAGSGFLLTFDIDQTTTVGVLTERTTYSDQKSAGAAPIAPTVGYSYSITAVRMQKDLTEMVRAGMDMGNITQTSNAGAVTGNGTVADVFANAKLITSKGSKVSSFMCVEMLYRIAKVNSNAETDMGGTQISLSAGC